MTTRVLQAFDTLDSHSKSMLDRFAKKNHQLTKVSTQCIAYGRSNTGLGPDHEFSARKKPKANKEIVNDEQDLLYKRLRKSLAVAAGMKGNKSVEAGSCRVIGHPEKHAANVKSSTGHRFRGKEEVGISFLIMPKKPETLRPYSQSSCRMTWSREVEKVPSLHELTKVTRSKALVGVSLGDTDIWHWCSRSVNDVDTPFKSPVPDGLMNTQQHQENVDNINIGTSVLHDKTEEEVCVEPDPLSFDDLLKRKDVKVLTPRLHKGFLSQQKASKTYPVSYSTQKHQYEPFSSPGFHFLDPAPQIRKRNIRSAIFLYTESMQAKYMIRSMRERLAGEGLRSHRPYTQPELKVKAGVNCVNISVLTADGKVIRSPDLARLPLHYHDETPSVCVSTPTNKLLLIPKQNVLSPCVGPVINGINPNQTCNSGNISPACCKTLAASPRKGLGRSAHTSTPQSQWNSSKNKTDFLSISRPLKCSQNGVSCIIREKQGHNGDWHKEAKEPYKNTIAEVTDCDTFSVHDMRFSRQSSAADTTPSAQEAVVIDLISTCSTTDSEKTHKHNASSCQPETIKIPTADYLD